MPKEKKNLSKPNIKKTSKKTASTLKDKRKIVKKNVFITIISNIKKKYFNNIYNNNIIKDEEKSEEIKDTDLSRQEKMRAEAQKISNDKKEKNVKITRQIKRYAIIFVFLIIIILLILAISIYNKYSPYFKYEDKMYTYGFADLYDNKKATTNETVTNSEAIKIILSAIYNSNDISDIASNDNLYKDYMWINHAVYNNIASSNELNESTINNKIDYIDVIRYLYNARVTLLDKTINTVDIEVKNIEKFNTEEQVAIKDLISKKILVISKDNLRLNEKIFKGKLNELIVNFVEKFNTITLDGDKINIDKDKEPSNVENYPYTLSNINKEIYEYEIYNSNEDKMYTPKDLYKYKKELFYEVKETYEELYNILINIDYNTITEETFLDSINKYLLHNELKENISQYVKYVKENEIIIKGAAKVQMPCVYFDGTRYRVRVKLDIEVENSKTRDNLLYLDLLSGGNITYEENESTLIIDAYGSNAINNSKIYPNIVNIYSTLLNAQNSGIIFKSNSNNLNGEEAVEEYKP